MFRERRKIRVESRGRITAGERDRDEDEVARKGRRETAMQTHKHTDKHTAYTAQTQNNTTLYSPV
jgi:hypothetical protein